MNTDIDRMLRIAQRVDGLTTGIGRIVRWAVLLDIVITAGNALSRKFLGLASNLAIDLQWHFLAALVLLMAGYTFKRNEHVRIDILSARFGPRYLAWLDAAGCLLVVVPLCALMVAASWPMFWQSLLANESSREVIGGLPRWVLKGLLPLGFGLLGMQALAEAIKRIAFLRGRAEYAPLYGQLIDGATP